MSGKWHFNPLYNCPCLERPDRFSLFLHLMLGVKPSVCTSDLRLNWSWRVLALDTFLEKTKIPEGITKHPCPSLTFCSVLCLFPLSHCLALYNVIRTNWALWDLRHKSLTQPVSGWWMHMIYATESKENIVVFYIPITDVHFFTLSYWEIHFPPACNSEFL